MGWPTPQEYNEAIQNPGSAFVDPELRSGQPVLTPLGLPRPITGAFASVYQLQCNKGRTVAVRCFLREFGDHQERYAAISAHLARAPLPYMTNFTYLANGIRVNGRWYPILKMDWLEGEALQTYVERNLHQPDVLRSLAEQWVQMAKLLRSASIGHGDLQHGNVLVCNGQLRLIDYDGMYVPALAGRQSHEIGHRNYQHPQRNERDFDPSIDYFSTWVVYTSLAALSVQPQLWQDYAGGDECLIFRREDFERPASSSLLRSLESASDARLVNLGAIFRSLTLLPVDRVPPIDGPINWPLNGAAAAPPPRAADWLNDHLARPQPAPAAGAAKVGAASVAAHAATAARSGSGRSQRSANGNDAAPDEQPAVATAASLANEPSWITDFLGGAPAQAEFGGDLAYSRQALRMPLAVVVLTWITFQWFSLALAVPAAVTAAAAAVALGMLANGYRHDPSVQAHWNARRDLRDVHSQVRRTSRRLQALQTNLQRTERKFAKQRARLDASRQRSKADEQAALARHDQRLQSQLADAQRQRDLLAKSGLEAVRRLEARCAAQLAATDKQIAGLHQAEEQELRQTLQRRQQQFVANYMKRQTIDAAVIAGIGASVKDALRKHGIVRAQDLEVHRLAQVEGIGEARTRVLLEWRRKAESLAAQTAPQNLSKIEETLIRGRYFQRRFTLEQEKGKVQRKLAKDIAAAQAHSAEQLKAADEEPQKRRAQSAQRRDEIRQRFQQGRSEVQASLARLNKEAAAQQKALDAEAAAVQQELSLLNAQRAAIEYRLQRYEGLHFGAYVQRVVLGG